jgi:hypothetical protein
MMTSVMLVARAAALRDDWMATAAPAANAAAATAAAAAGRNRERPVEGLTIGSGCRVRVVAATS